AFLSLSTNKSSVYVGEGFTLSLAFYVARTNQAPLQFYDVSDQLRQVIKTFKPKKCWEENFQIQDIRPESVQLSGKAYDRYLMYQASFFPLTQEDIFIPPVAMKFIKYKLARQPSFFGQNRKKAFKTFYTRPRSVEVKALPAHPLRDHVPVGEYRLKERLSAGEVETGQSFEYHFTIEGEGNISSLKAPQNGNNLPISWYPPTIEENLERAYGRIYGKKTFSYYGIPKKAGEYMLGDDLSWIFFHPRKEKYDTLRSGLSLRAFGKNQYDVDIRSHAHEAFYERAKGKDHELQVFQGSGLLKWLSYVGGGLVLVSLGFVFLRG
ncbi:MAG: BatD family protein, partial [Cytophagales bacterium]|nr:BatD family protein [Cytophagales bacterium]